MNASMKSDSQGFLVGERVATGAQPDAMSGVSILRSMRTDVGVIRRLLEAGAGQRMRTAKAQAVTARGRGASVPVGAVAATVADRRSAGLRTTGAGVATVQNAARGASNMPARDARGRFLSTHTEPVVVAMQRGAVVPKAGLAATSGQAGTGERDARGRFAGGGQQSSDYAGGDGLLGKISKTLDGIGGAVGNTDRIDPTLAALKEVRDVVSPVGRGVMSLGQRLAERRKERWYDRILKAIKGGKGKGEGGGAGVSGADVKSGSFFGTMLGEISGKLLGALGEISGQVLGALGSVGGLLARVFAPVAAAWASWEVGQWLGKKLYDWLTESGLMGKIFDAFDEMVGGVKKAVAAGAKVASDSKLGSDEARYRPLTPEDRREARLDRRGSAPDSMAYKAGAVAGTVMRGADVAGGAIRRLLGVIETGPGFNVTKNADGSVTRQVGARNWRNNNPGNIEYGPFAKRMGAIGTDGRFAVFPDYETGRKAKASLIFEGKSYRDLSLKDAISRYAPPSENDTATYQRTVLASVGGANRKMADYSPAERSAILDAMQRVEGFKTGTVSVVGGAAAAGMRSAPTATVDMASLVPVHSVSVPMSTPKHMPAAQAANIPERLNSSKQPPINVSVRGEVGQDVGDRTIAHVVTGGMGGKH